MTAIHINLVPKKIQIRSILTNDIDGLDQNHDVRNLRIIYLKGIPEYGGTYGSHTTLRILQGDGKTELPKHFSIRIVENRSYSEYENGPDAQSNNAKNEIGALYFIPALEDWEMGRNPHEFTADIKVNKEQFENFITLIQSRKAKLIASVSFQGNSPEGIVQTDTTGYRVTWDLDKSKVLDLQSFSLDALYTNETNTLNKMLSKKLSILENELKELKNKKISIF